MKTNPHNEGTNACREKDASSHYLAEFQNVLIKLMDRKFADRGNVKVSNNQQIDGYRYTHDQSKCQDNLPLWNFRLARFINKQG